MVYSVKEDALDTVGEEGEPVYYPVWDSRDDALLYTLMTDFGPQVWRRDLAGNTAEPLTDTKAISVAPSPDGRFLYLLKSRHGLWLKDRETGEEVLIAPTVDRSAWGSLVAFDDGVYWRQDVEDGYHIRHWTKASGGLSTVLAVPQSLLLNMRYFHVDRTQQKISFYRMTDHQSNLVFFER